MTEPPPKIAAFFDFDRTIVDTDGGVLFGHELLRLYRHDTFEEGRGTVGWIGRILRYYVTIARIVSTSLVARLLYYLRIIRRSTLVNIAYSALKGRSVAELRSLGEDFANEVLKHRVYPDVRRLMEDHRRQGHRVVIATTNMRVLVDHFRSILPVDDVIAVDLLERNGLATGKVVGPRYGAEKAKAIRDYAHAHGISLPKSYAYTDHYSDHFILPVVGHPRVVNPRWRMRRFARRRKWDILAFPPLPPPSKVDMPEPPTGAKRPA